MRVLLIIIILVSGNCLYADNIYEPIDFVSVNKHARAGSKKVQKGHVSKNDRVNLSEAQMDYYTERMYYRLNNYYGGVQKINAASDSISIKLKEINGGNKGTFQFGGTRAAVDFAKEDINTFGLYSEYKLNRLKINSKLSNTRNMRSDTSLYKFEFTPEYMLTNRFSVKYIHQQNLAAETYYQGVGIKYVPKSFRDNLEFEMDTKMKYNNYAIPSQSINFSTKFKL